MAEILKNGIYVSFDSREKGFDMSNLHYHDFYEVYFLNSGVRRYVVDNTIYDLKAGDIILVNKSEFHITKNLGKNNGYKRYLLYITEDVLHSLGDNSITFEHLFKNRVISLDDKQIRRVEFIFEQLLENYNCMDELFSRQLLVNGSYELFAIIYRALGEKNFQKGRRFFGGSVDKALEFIYNNYKSAVSLEDLANLCNMNKSYFSRYFKKVTGISFIRYLTALRIKEACHLLKTTDMPVCDVADKSGFESQQHFCSVFKRETGTSALRYRFDNKGGAEIVDYTNKIRQ